MINQFVESRSQFKNGLVNHAFAAALRALLLVVSLCCKSCDYSASLYCLFLFVNFNGQLRYYSLLPSMCVLLNYYGFLNS